MAYASAGDYAGEGLHAFPVAGSPHDEDDELGDDLSDAVGSDSGSVEYDSGESSVAPEIHFEARQAAVANPAFRSKRHSTCGNPTPITPGNEKKPAHWRLNAQLKKTNQAALILCLNIGCDPPDVVKTNPCAILEAWMDPYTMPPSKALNSIGVILAQQFEILNAKGKYKAYLDPSVEEFKKCMGTLRERCLSKDERALVYYNGHGVPKPTSNGEFWVFNSTYTQYIPVSLNDFQDWIGAPSTFIWDCSAAGNILVNYKKFAEPKDEQMRQMYPDGNFPTGYSPLMDCLQLFACGPGETLPMSPDLPADLFTACLTTPIEMALRFFVLQNKRYSQNISLEMLMKIPGSLKDRRSPLGELHWIFTAVTDTIAWSTFSNDIFRRLFRQDLVTASLFRHFLLAERVMRHYDCTPQSYPPLPPTHTHKMWAAWDHAVDICVSRLPAYMELLPPPADPPPTPAEGGSVPAPDGPPLPDWPPNPFFEEHLTAFQVWLNRGSSPVEDAGMRYQPTATRSGEGSRGFMYHPSEAEQNTPRRPPYQLPVLLQVLLSQAHRLRALILLAQFVDLGPWAVHLALEIGIFPYVHRLLQSPAPDVKPLLIFIWARIIAIDPSCQVDLLPTPPKPGEFNSTNPVGYRYFAALLAPQHMSAVTIVNASEHLAMCAFIVAMVCRDHPTGQDRCFADNVFDSVMDRLEDEDFFLRQWSALCIAQMWDAKDDIKAFGVERGAHDRLMDMLNDVAPEVRAAAMYALAVFLGASGSATDARRGGGGTGGLLRFELRDQFRIEVAVGTRAMLAGREDASPLVRKELLVLLSALVVEWRGWFVIAAWLYWEWDKANRGQDKGKSPLEEGAEREGFQHVIADWIQAASAADPRARADPVAIQEENRVLLSSFFTILAALFDLSVDPYPEVANMARMIIDYIMALLVESAFARLPSSTLVEFPKRTAEEEHPAISRALNNRSPTPTPRSRVPSLQMSSLSPALVADLQSAMPYRRGSLHRSDSYTSSTTAASSPAPQTAQAIKRTASLAASLKTLALPASSEPTSPHSTGSLSHLTDHLPGSPPAPEPHVVVIDYVPPWNVKAASTPLPTPSPRDRNGSDKGSWNQRQPPKSSPTNGIKLSPSWSSLSTPRPPFAPSTLVFPKKSPATNGNGHGSHHHGHHGHHAHTEDFTAFDVICALVDEDLSRQKTRYEQYMERSHRPPSEPSNLALGTIDTMIDLLPFRSTLFDSCAEYYSEPQMKQPDMDEPGSNAYSVHMWKKLKMDERASEASRAARVADFCHWDQSISTINSDLSIARVALHASQNHLAIADDTNLVSVWDWSRKKRLSLFSNANPLGSNITSLDFINQEDEEGMVLTGSSDGVVRVYRNYVGQGEDPVELVTSWRALSDRIKVKRGSGLVLDWQQDNGLLLAGGDTRSVRIWDVHRELCIQEFPTHAASSVTSIASDGKASTLFATGHADGSLHIFDRRLRQGSVFRTSEGHRAWIRNVHWQKRGRGELVSGSADGTVIVWDVRKAVPHVVANPQPKGLSSMAVHDEANVIVTTSSLTANNWRQQTISVDSIPLYNRNIVPTPLSRQAVPTGISQPPASPIDSTSGLAFHPFRMLYAAGGADGIVRLYGAKTEGVRPHKGII